MAPSSAQSRQYSGTFKATLSVDHNGSTMQLNGAPLADHGEQLRDGDKLDFSELAQRSKLQKSYSFRGVLELDGFPSAAPHASRPEPVNNSPKGSSDSRPLFITTVIPAYPPCSPCSHVHSVPPQRCCVARSPTAATSCCGSPSPGVTASFYNYPPAPQQAPQQTPQQAPPALMYPTVAAASVTPTLHIQSATPASSSCCGGANIGTPIGLNVMAPATPTVRVESLPPASSSCCGGASVVDFNEVTAVQPPLLALSSVAGPNQVFQQVVPPGVVCLPYVMAPNPPALMQAQPPPPQGVPAPPPAIPTLHLTHQALPDQQHVYARNQ